MTGGRKSYHHVPRPDGPKFRTETVKYRHVATDPCNWRDLDVKDILPVVLSRKESLLVQILNCVHLVGRTVSHLEPIITVRKVRW